MRLFCIIKNVYYTEIAGYLAVVKEDRDNRETLETFQEDRQVTMAVEYTRTATLYVDECLFYFSHHCLVYPCLLRNFNKCIVYSSKLSSSCIIFIYLCNEKGKNEEHYLSQLGVELKSYKKGFYPKRRVNAFNC